ncbi:MAG: division/cell wall cluster transcriptional repressor MraZ [Desulfatitalea sp.]|nr:division/cell wall cluster transcriptional repressor MraZ [Desulfatitalea sp.]NNK01704.1 division/cell wall cluster transcriptional repressor MraZ [Desulfatitalea sp.]
MFRGSSTHILDDKGRFVIPARFRDYVRASGGDVLMITRMDGTLFAYPLNEWNKIENRIMSLAEKSDSLRRFRRVFVGGAYECSWDKQSRVLIPPALRQYAQLEKDIVLVGVQEHFEIWSQPNWEKENETMEKDMQQVEVRNEIAKLGL